MQRLAEADLPAELEVPAAAAPRHLGRRHRRRDDGARDHLLAAPQATVRRARSRRCACSRRPSTRATRPLTDSQLWHQMVTAQKSLASSDVRPRLGDALEQLRLASEDRPLPFGALARRLDALEHEPASWPAAALGLGALRDRRARWAWTAATTASTRSPTREGFHQGSVVRGLELAGVPEEPGSDEHLVAATYLAAITCRYLDGAESELGAAIADRSRGDAGRPSCAWLGATRRGTPWLSGSPVRQADPLGARARTRRASVVAAPVGSTRWGTLTSRWRLQPSFIIARCPASRHHDALPRAERAPAGRPADRVEGHRLLRPELRQGSTLVPRDTSR